MLQLDSPAAHSTPSAPPPPALRSFYARHAKRWFDAVVALLALLILAPVLVALSLGVLLSSGLPVFFRQERTGLRGSSFRIWKFRSMRNSTSAPGPLVTASGDSRVTPFGRWLRRTKCDELPQLFNVLFGEMSLVGPRPEVPLYTREFTSDQRRVFLVRPGITGPTATTFISEEDLLASQPDKDAYYRNVLLPAKLAGDLEYIRSLAFNTDLKLIANTVSRLLLKSS